MKIIERREGGSGLLLVVLPQVLRVPRVCEYKSFQVLELVRAIVDGSAHAVWTFIGGAQNSRPLHFGVLEHPSKDEASIGERDLPGQGREREGLFVGGGADPRRGER